MNKHVARLARPAALVALCGALAISLQGCIGMVVGTAAVGTLAAIDRRTLGAQTEDKAIVVKGEARLPDIVGSAGHVNVTSFNRKVLLTGEVPDEAVKAAAERHVAAIDGVQGVVNELEVGAASGVGGRSNDTYITGKVKSSFVAEKELSADAIKVVTERGNVYLMGRVTEREGRLAAEVARGVGGVRKVVKVFEYISEQELKALTAG